MRDIYEIIDSLDTVDRDYIEEHTRGRCYDPDVILAPDGDPYLLRWHLIHDNTRGNVFLHLQIKSDPERPLHDHPWDNTSIILRGGYDEIYEMMPWLLNRRCRGRVPRHVRKLRLGTVRFRVATTAHRLVLPAGIPYAMTLFVTGPKIREWGFWYPDGFHHNKRHCDDRPAEAGMVSYGRHDK